MIALLNEQKQAIIHRAVTRGLDPAVPLKPSGIPWLGDIPQHWEVLEAEVNSSAIDDPLHPSTTIRESSFLSASEMSGTDCWILGDDPSKS